MFNNVSNVLTGPTSLGEAAKKLETTCKSVESTQSSPSPDRGDSTQPVKPSPSTQPQPLIILAFDEAHTLTKFASEDEDEDEDEDEGVISGQSPFSHLRRALRSIRQLSFFSLFLSTSTTGKITPFTSARAVDHSTRVQTGKLSLIPPFIALGWDHLSKGHPLNLASFNFHNIGFQYQVLLGRPM